MKELLRFYGTCLQEKKCTFVSHPPISLLSLWAPTTERKSLLLVAIVRQIFVGRVLRIRVVPMHKELICGGHLGTQ
jgi:hypothetical protein